MKKLYVIKSFLLLLLSAVSFPSIAQTCPGVPATLPFTEGFEAAWINGCATADQPNTHWVNGVATGNPSWRREDDAGGLNTAGWTSPGFYGYTPAGSNAGGASSSHSARFHQGYVTGGGQGSLNLYINLPAGAKQISYDYINGSPTTGANSSIQLQISVDGGTTFTNIGTSHNGPVGWTTYTEFTTASASSAILRWLATADFGSYDIGLDNVNVNLLPPCAGTPTAGTVSASPTSGCGLYNSALTLPSAPLQTGINYQWQSSPDNATWTSIPSGTNSSFTTGVLTNTYFRAQLTCANGGTTASTPGLLLTNTAAPVAAILPFTEGFEAAWINGCATSDLPNNHWLNSPATGNPSWRREDDAGGANTAGWTSPGFYGYTPAGSTAGGASSSHSARFHQGYVTGGGQGSINLYVNMPAGSKQISYDYINGSPTTGANSSIRLQISVDGGATFTNIGTSHNGPVGWTTYTETTTAASPTAILRWLATADFGSYDIGLDNVNVIRLCNAQGTIVGNSTVCAGATTPYTDPTGVAGGTWSSSNTTIATVGSTGIVTGVAPGIATITYNLSNPCGALATQTISVNPSPSVTTGAVLLCTGVRTTIGVDLGNGTWTSSNTSAVTVTSSDANTGVATGGAATGTSVITYTIPSGCFLTIPVAINATPGTNTVTGGGPYCAAGPGSGVHIGLNGSSVGNSYGLYNGSTLAGTLAGTGTPLDFGLISTPGASYTIVATSSAGCLRTMSGSTAVVANPVPPVNLLTQTGGTNFCSGNPSPIQIGLDGSATGINYQLLNNGVVTGSTAGGTGSPFNFGFISSPGNFKVIAMNPGTGCVDTMTGSGSITVTPSPAVYNVSGSGTFCAGAAGAAAHILLSGSGTGVNYQLKNGGLPAGSPVAGTGSPLDFGLLTSAGTYTIAATSQVTGCSINMSGSGTLILSATPNPYGVTGGGNYCAGAAGQHVGLLSSGSGINYSLFRNGAFVDSVSGTNAAIDFGQFTSAGNYTVVADNATTHCAANMTGSVIIVVNNPPSRYSVTGGGKYCIGGTGVPIGLSNSQASAFYQLYNNGTTAVGGAITGTGTVFNLGATYTAPGIYTIVGTSVASGCKDTMTGSVTVGTNSLPAVYAVSGGGVYCAGGSGLPVLLSNTDTSVNYILFNGGAPAGASIAGTGSAAGFSNLTAGGNYTVVASNAVTGCTSNMTGSAAVVISPAPYVYNVTGTGSYCSSNAGRNAGLSFSDAGITYMLYNGTTLIDSVAGIGAAIDFGTQTGPATYHAIAVNTATRCSSNMAGSAAIAVSAAPAAHNVTGGGSVCSGSSAGRHIGLDASDAGVSYQLMKAGLPVGSAVPGVAGEAIDFGVFTSTGTYSIIASASGCTTTMAGNAAIANQPLPTLYLLTGGGNYCPGGTGVNLALSGSSAGVSYQLYDAGSPVDAPVIGTGSSFNFGLHVANGIYTAIATDPTGCTNAMGGYPAIVILPAPPAHTVTGGGSYCAGTTGRSVNIDGSDTGIRYQLKLNGTASGAPVAGNGSALNFGTFTTQGAYTVTAVNDITGCTAAMPGAPNIMINPLPGVETVTGGGVFCAGGAGVPVTLAASVAGDSYQLFRGGVATSIPIMNGTGSPLNFGMQTTPGAYTVVASTSAGCTANMAGSASVAISAPAVYTISGGGIYCLGATAGHIMLSGSAAGVSYQLFSGASLAGGPVSGTGTTLDLGLPVGAGTYTAVGTSVSSGCTANMAGTAVVVVNALPAIYPVTGGGQYCSGGIGMHVGLSGSDAGISYQLYNSSSTATGSPLAGTGVSIDFGLVTAASSYTVKATNPATGCTSNMADDATIIIRPTPAAYPVTVENFGNYCTADSGVHIGLGGSGSGINYNLYKGSSLMATLSGTGGALNFGLQTAPGTYTVSAADPVALCNNNMSGSPVVNAVTSPVVQTLSGGGSYCPGDPGSDVLLGSSESGISYQLYNGAGMVGTAVAGTGGAVHFGLEAIGSYTATGNNMVTISGHSITCATPMTGTVAVAYSPLLEPVITVASYPAGVKVAQIDSVKAVVSNAGPSPTYQWVLNGYPLPGAVQSILYSPQMHNGDSLACIVTASGPCGGLTASGHVIASLSVVGVAQVTATGNDIRLAPNPNKGIFTVKGSLGVTSDEEITLEVTNMLGQTVYTNKVTARGGSIDERIDLGGSLASGMYIMTLRSGTQNNAIHFTVEQ